MTFNVLFCVDPQIQLTPFNSARFPYEATASSSKQREAVTKPKENVSLIDTIKRHSAHSYAP